MRLILSFILLVSSTQAFDLNSWVPLGSNQVNLCWPTVENTDHFEVFVGRAFIGQYEWSNTVDGNGAVHTRPVLPGREFIYVAAFDANDQLIERSDTVGCYYLLDLNVPVGRAKGVSFGIGKLEYVDQISETQCDFSDVISNRPSDIVGIQLVPGGFSMADRIARQDGGSMAYRATPTGVWNGPLESGASMIAGRAYYFATIQNSRSPIITDRANSNFIADGMVTITGGSMTVTTPICFPIIDVTHVAALGLETSGFSRGNPLAGDAVLEQGTGRMANLNAQGQWRGSLDYCYPERAYYILNRPHSNGTWTYNFSSVGLP